MDWQKPEAVLPPRLVVGVHGWEKAGKTHFALTGRKPIRVFNLDSGLEGVVEKFGDDVLEWKYPMVRPNVIADSPENANPEFWQRHWKAFMAAVSKVYAEEPGTVIFDTFTEVYEEGRLAHFGKLEQIQPQRYGVVYAELRGILRMAHDAQNTTTVFISKSEADFNTGKEQPKGWKELQSRTQVNLHIENKAATIIQCRQRLDVEGIPLEGANFSLRYLEWLIREWQGEGT